jgi:GT2 family glycosyltransferase
MGLRRDFVEQLGGFDDFFGPGGRFPSADEFDLSIRALLSGWHV